MSTIQQVVMGYKPRITGVEVVSVGNSNTGSASGVATGRPQISAYAFEPPAPGATVTASWLLAGVTFVRNGLAEI